jgi:hypothetical protein
MTNYKPTPKELDDIAITMAEFDKFCEYIEKHIKKNISKSAPMSASPEKIEIASDMTSVANTDSVVVAADAQSSSSTRRTNEVA